MEYLMRDKSKCQTPQLYILSFLFAAVDLLRSESHSAHKFYSIVIKHVSSTEGRRRWRKWKKNFLKNCVRSVVDDLFDILYWVKSSRMGWDCWYNLLLNNDYCSCFSRRLCAISLVNHIQICFWLKSHKGWNRERVKGKNTYQNI